MYSWLLYFFTFTPTVKTIGNPGNHTRTKNNQEQYRENIQNRENINKISKILKMCKFKNSKIYVVAGGSHQNNLIPCTGPLKKKYMSAAHRRRSFQDARHKPKCNDILKSKIEELVAAGFYYPRLMSDLVRCFYCGGQVRGWSIESNPWIEHASSFPECGFTKLNRGDKFIKTCIDLDRGVVEAEKWREKVQFVELESQKSITELEEDDNDDLLCRVCLTGKREIVTLPCSHIATCISCAASFDKCIVCRTDITAYLKVFF